MSHGIGCLAGCMNFSQSLRVELYGQEDVEIMSELSPDILEFTTIRCSDVFRRVLEHPRIVRGEDHQHSGSYSRRSIS